MKDFYPYVARYAPYFFPHFERQIGIIWNVAKSSLSMVHSKYSLYTRCCSCHHNNISFHDSFFFMSVLCRLNPNWKMCAQTEMNVHLHIIFKWKCFNFWLDCSFELCWTELKVHNSRWNFSCWWPFLFWLLFDDCNLNNVIIHLNNARTLK